jgi:hypothetical protein
MLPEKTPVVSRHAAKVRAILDGRSAKEWHEAQNTAANATLASRYGQ